MTKLLMVRVQEKQSENNSCHGHMMKYMLEGAGDQPHNGAPICVEGQKLGCTGGSDTERSYRKAEGTMGQGYNGCNDSRSGTRWAEGQGGTSRKHESVRK